MGGGIYRKLAESCGKPWDWVALGRKSLGQGNVAVGPMLNCFILGIT